MSKSFGQTTGSSDTVGSTIGSSVGQTNSSSVSHSNGESWGTNSTVGTGESWSTGQGTNWSNGTSHNESFSNSDTVGASQSQSTGTTSSQTDGTSHSVSNGTTQTDSFTHSTADTTGKSWGTTTGISHGNSTSQSIGHTVGQAMGTSGTITNGSTTSMGIGPAIGYAKSYQWMDQEVKNILTLLDFQNMRLMKALRGNGAFFTDVYIATDSTESLAAASILAKSAWANTEAMICPLQILDLTPEEQNHLIYHFYAFSADNRKEGLGGRMESYRYSTILLSDEFAAYTHLPRISEGGMKSSSAGTNDVGDVPKFAVPSMKKGDIYIGKILSGERWTPSTGYETPFEYRLEESELMHGIFTGESRSGKTVAATRFVSELTKVRRKSGKRLRIVALDPKQDWRILAKFVEPERFHFYSLGNPEFLPIKLNILKVPHNVNPQVWLDGIIEIYCRAYGLMERGKAILAETLYALYDEAGVFEDSPNWREFVPERSAKVTFPKVYERMNQIKLDLEDPLKSGKGRMGNEARDAYTRVLDRMQIFGRKFSIETRLFGQEDGIGVDELIGKDDVIVLESYGLETTFRNFMFGCITSGFFKYAQGHEGGFLADDQYETVLVIELTHKTPDEMAADYHFTTRQNTYLQLLQDPQYEELWAELLGGFAQGGGELMTPDSTRTPTGTLQWPLPVAGTITSQFGHRVDPITGEVSSHTGTDIACAEGTPILAAADGVITVANGLDSWGGSYGYYIQIDHGGGLETLYAHCSSICVTTGQQVQSGQVIGYVGHTGRATGSHLHFEIHINKIRKDAMSYFGM